MKTLKVYTCKHCGNVVITAVDGGVTPMCCGEKMVELKANTVDAATEKHVPSVNVSGSHVEVSVGSVWHPMTEEHLISWIAMVDNSGKTQFVTLDANDEPKASFDLGDAHAATVYAYCNLHGLWSTDITA